MELTSRRAFALVLAVGVVGTGIVVALFSAAGYRTLGSAIWVVGYGTMVLILWWGWLRPLDMGPDSVDPEGENG
jgi:hypothetical protein